MKFISQSQRKITKFVNRVQGNIAKFVPRFHEKKNHKISQLVMGKYCDIFQLLQKILKFVNVAGKNRKIIQSDIEKKT